MKIISFDDLDTMDENEIILVSKNAIHIQIIKYESVYYNTCPKIKELEILTRTLFGLLEVEQKSNRQIQSAKMTVSEIRECFTKENYPRSTFIQYN